MTNIGIKSQQLSNIRAALLDTAQNNSLEPKKTKNFGNQIAIQGLLNSDCRDQSDPTSCPNTWKYMDSSDGYAWKADSDLTGACGTKNVPSLSSHHFLNLQYLKHVLLPLTIISFFPK